ncbi:hypothetical protein E4U61_003285, partial [Claviceps capensis]
NHSRRRRDSSASSTASTLTCYLCKNPKRPHAFIDCPDLTTAQMLLGAYKKNEAAKKASRRGTTKSSSRSKRAYAANSAEDSDDATQISDETASDDEETTGLTAVDTPNKEATNDSLVQPVQPVQPPPHPQHSQTSEQLDIGSGLKPGGEPGGEPASRTPSLPPVAYVPQADKTDRPDQPDHDRQLGDQVLKESEVPRYFTRSTRKRSDSDMDGRDSKRLRALIAKILNNGDELNLDALKGMLGEDFESAFPAEIIAGVKIPRTYEEA